MNLIELLYSITPNRVGFLDLFKIEDAPVEEVIKYVLPHLPERMLKNDVTESSTEGGALAIAMLNFELDHKYLKRYGLELNESLLTAFAIVLGKSYELGYCTGFYQGIKQVDTFIGTSRTSLIGGGISVIIFCLTKAGKDAFSNPLFRSSDRRLYYPSQLTDILLFFKQKHEKIWENLCASGLIFAETSMNCGL